MCILCPQVDRGEITYISILLKNILIINMFVQGKLTQHLIIVNIFRRANKEMNEHFFAINNLFNNVMPIYLMVIVILNENLESLDMNMWVALMAP
jgi:mannose/fructose/N-acetylgalactosamine-specific phosphotransferase system component IID